jgi:hypothetical protein
VQQKRGEKGDTEKKDDLNLMPIISNFNNSSRTKSSRQLVTKDPLVKDDEMLEVAETPKQAASSTINSRSNARPAEAQNHKSEHRQENESGENGIKIGRQGNENESGGNGIKIGRRGNENESGENGIKIGRQGNDGKGKGRIFAENRSRKTSREKTGDNLSTSEAPKTKRTKRKSTDENSTSEGPIKKPKKAKESKEEKDKQSGPVPEDKWKPFEVPPAASDVAQEFQRYVEGLING